MKTQNWPGGVDPENLINSEALREALDYDENTGIFTRKKHVGGPVRVGDVVGSRNAYGYLNIRLYKKQYLAHRLAWFYVYEVWPDGQIDHINGIRADNRIINLRCVSIAENRRNHAIPRDNSSGVIGVCPSSKKKGHWRAYITKDNKQTDLGHFESIDAAAAARSRASQQFGFHENHGRHQSEQ